MNPQVETAYNEALKTDDVVEFLRYTADVATITQRLIGECKLPAYIKALCEDEQTAYERLATRIILKGE